MFLHQAATLDVVDYTRAISHFNVGGHRITRSWLLLDASWLQYFPVVMRYTVLGFRPRRAAISLVGSPEAFAALTAAAPSAVSFAFGFFSPADERP